MSHFGAYFELAPGALRHPPGSALSERQVWSTVCQYLKCGCCCSLVTFDFIMNLSCMEILHQRSFHHIININSGSKQSRPGGMCQRRECIRPRDLAWSKSFAKCYILINFTHLFSIKQYILAGSFRIGVQRTQAAEKYGAKSNTFINWGPPRTKTLHWTPLLLKPPLNVRFPYTQKNRLGIVKQTVPDPVGSMTAFQAIGCWFESTLVQTWFSHYWCKRHLRARRP